MIHAVHIEIHCLFEVFLIFQAHLLEHFLEALFISGFPFFRFARSDFPDRDRLGGAVDHTVADGVSRAAVGSGDLPDIADGTSDSDRHHRLAYTARKPAELVAFVDDAGDFFLFLHLHQHYGIAEIGEVTHVPAGKKPLFRKPAHRNIQESCAHPLRDMALRNVDHADHKDRTGQGELKIIQRLFETAFADPPFDQRGEKALLHQRQAFVIVAFEHLHVLLFIEFLVKRLPDAQKHLAQLFAVDRLEDVFLGR